MKRFLCSAIVLSLLYGLVFAVADLWLARHHAPMWVAMAFAAATVALQYWYAPRIIEWLMAIQWDDLGAELPVRNREFLRTLCTDRKLPFPRIGIVHSDTPNAFSFGHAPQDARVVVTTGLLKILSPEEINAVLAHVMGHVAHWDVVVMTLAALAPLMLFQFYRVASQARAVAPQDGSDSNTRMPPLVVEGAYLAYLLSRFLVLLLSRTCEYSADRFAARVTGTPNALVSALVKIAYGMLKVDGEFRHAMQGSYGQQRALLDGRRQEAESLALMGICNLRAGQVLALGDARGRVSASLITWDLVNPWARLYELSSTHPLTALRIRALNREAAAMRQPVSLPLPEDQPMRWGSFPLEVILWAAPLTAAILWATMLSYGYRPAQRLAPSVLVFIGIAWALRTWFRYYGRTRPATIRELMEDITVSQMRSRAVRLEGTIIGFGVPGAFWCPDLVLRDSTGMLYVLYRQSIPFARLFFALSSAERYIGRNVVIEGWFRRGLRPYIEMSCLTGDDRQPRRAYSRRVQYAAAAAVSAGGVAWMVMR
jgi:Zn-dependent protease with chaperone function